MQTLAFGGNPTAWIIGLVVIVVLFGGAKIPELMKGMGQGMRELKKGLNEEEDDELRKEREKEERIRAEVRARIEEEERLKYRENTKEKETLNK